MNTTYSKSPTNSTINFGDIVCSCTHLFSKDSGCICLLICLLTQDELKNPPLWSYLGYSTNRSTQYRRCQQHRDVKTCTEVKGLWVMKSQDNSRQQEIEKVTVKDWKSKSKGRRHGAVFIECKHAFEGGSLSSWCLTSFWALAIKAKWKS